MSAYIFRFGTPEQRVYKKPPKLIVYYSNVLGRSLNECQFNHLIRRPTLKI